MLPLVDAGVAAVLWGSLLLIAHTYVLFPLLLARLARGRKQNQQVYGPADPELPPVDILLAVYNEEQVIEEKIRSTFATSYPLDKLTFYIGSDNSQDQTNALITRLSAAYPQLRFRPFHQRTGKPGVMEALSAEATAPVLVLTDANVFFTPDTLYHLVKHFRNPHVGQVGGNILNPDSRHAGISGQEKAYLERENLLKYQEGVVWGAMIGAFGGCFAVRRECYQPAPSSFIVDDFFISMAVLQEGYQAINELEAICHEDVSDKLPEEFRRKARISTGNFQNLVAFRRLLWPPWRGVSFAYWSHKVLRWLTPLLLVLMLLSNLVLVLRGAGWFYQLMLAGQVAAPAVLLLDSALHRLNVHFRLLRFITHFYSMNMALLVGLWRFLKGVKTTVWEPTQRFQHKR
ncbi:cellulose synthase/poly-beta-1,6-N-acetylglucosamine synthase-like glycosyltransferase [Hymenobacter luteus]|uniref:Cellulose synthase/poly-beta-1,6-N-acetylglucosamine synthase-like glycosyltransferase n=2 Tax=Hymenobacter TaxID=89966 RepID=A0A7W9WD81_9BACT|nr:glycosyltransferase [Hymenobacter latericoloratus]MBB4602164.1 cellulose synthase/poly-beta-1,6-N-acetylglucosamine synthase-like glycosyltransferase [Hymenobacter latericoloratus]MBB6059407.1 cellulose synthase/poly-beta-1,6-N-acetylglucosamine synthase-like glycosyltransferase [Hymenobacter luteus]